MDTNNPVNRLTAESDWNEARRKVLYQEVVCFFKTCSVDLLSFAEVRTGLHLDQKIDRGVQEIPLDSIRGSVGRYEDFTSAFMPRKSYMQDRWKNVDMAVMAGKAPPIDVYQVGESYFVLDGNHRVSVARQHGRETIEAYVGEFTTPIGLSPEADIDELLIKSEQVAYLEKIGHASPSTLQEITFTCPDCYGDLVDMIETYRQGLEDTEERPVSLEQAVEAWHEEVYLPGIEKIRGNNLMAQFPERTEADMFVWAWKNNKVLEELALEDENLTKGGS